MHVTKTWELCVNRKHLFLETADVGAMKKVSNQFGEDKCTFVFVV